MAKSEIDQIKDRLQKAISVLEAQTEMLKKDLGRLNDLETDDSTEEVAQQVAATEQQIEANEEVIEKVKKESDDSLVSELERETLKMLERMQNKIQSKEILSDLYEQQPEVSREEPLSEATVEENTDTTSQESDDDFFENLEMEKVVDKLKKQDSLEEFKRKMGLK